MRHSNNCSNYGFYILTSFNVPALFPSWSVPWISTDIILAISNGKIKKLAWSKVTSRLTLWKYKYVDFFPPLQINFFLSSYFIYYTLYNSTDNSMACIRPWYKSSHWTSFFSKSSQSSRLMPPPHQQALLELFFTE